MVVLLIRALFCIQFLVQAPFSIPPSSDSDRRVDERRPTLRITFSTEYTIGYPGTSHWFSDDTYLNEDRFFIDYP